MSNPSAVCEYNPLCGRCRRGCRQPAHTVLVDCPRFLPFPFKVASHRFDQLDLFAPEKQNKR